MESHNPLLIGNSQRRRLTKKPPSTHQHTSSLSIDGRIDAQSLGSRRSSASLQRAPSAPQARASSSHASESSSPRYIAGLSTASSFASRSRASPSLPSTNEFPTPVPSQTQPPPSQSSYPFFQSQPQAVIAARSDAKPLLPSANAARPLSTKTSEELIGAPFDGNAILNRIAATKSPIPSPAHHFAPQRPAPPAPPAAPPPSHTSPDPRGMGPPPFPQTNSISRTLSDKPVTGEKAATSKMESAPVSKRFSDESKESKPPSMLRKKSGFSGFMTSLVGSPKKPLISAPENPVHVTHVGYDSLTGQFTVSCRIACLLALPEIKVCSNSQAGTTQGMAAANQ